MILKNSKNKTVKVNKEKPLFPFFNCSFDKKRLKHLFSWYYANKGDVAAFSLAQTLKDIGFLYATKAGISLGVDDLKIPSNKKFSLKQAAEILETTKISVKSGNRTSLEEFQDFIDTWHRTSENLTTSIIRNFQNRLTNPTFSKEKLVNKSTKPLLKIKDENLHRKIDMFSKKSEKKYELINPKEEFMESSFIGVGEDLNKVENIFSKKNKVLFKENKQIKFPDTVTTKEPKPYGNLLNPVYMMAFSGARGNLSQVKQLLGMRGLMANPKGQLVEFPIQSNFREGLTVTEYMISCYGARKGLVDTALRTAAAGYLTRRLVDVSHHQIVRFVNCGTKHSICFISNESKYKRKREGKETKEENLPSSWIIPLKRKEKKKYHLQTKGINSCIGRILAENIPGLAFKNQEVDVSLSCSPIFRKTYDTFGIFVRSPLTCAARKGICQLCYGWTVSANRLVSLGEAVGIIAAQSVGEPGTQLTMRTFHTGGVFSGDVMEECRATHPGIVQFESPYLGLLVRTGKGSIAFCIRTPGVLSIKGSKEITTINLLPNNLIFVRQGEKVKTGQLLIEIPNLPDPNEERYEVVTNKPEYSSKTVYSEFSGEIRRVITNNLTLQEIIVLAAQNSVYMCLPYRNNLLKNILQYKENVNNSNLNFNNKSDNEIIENRKFLDFYYQSKSFIPHKRNNLLTVTQSFSNFHFSDKINRRNYIKSERRPFIPGSHRIGSYLINSKEGIWPLGVGRNNFMVSKTIENFKNFQRQDNLLNTKKHFSVFKETQKHSSNLQNLKNLRFFIEIVKNHETFTEKIFYYKNFISNKNNKENSNLSFSLFNLKNNIETKTLLKELSFLNDNSKINYREHFLNENNFNFKYSKINLGKIQKSNFFKKTLRFLPFPIKNLTLSLNEKKEFLTSNENLYICYLFFSISKKQLSNFDDNFLNNKFNHLSSFSSEKFFSEDFKEYGLINNLFWWILKNPIEKNTIFIKNNLKSSKNHLKESNILALNCLFNFFPFINLSNYHYLFWKLSEIVNIKSYNFNIFMFFQLYKKNKKLYKRKTSIFYKYQSFLSSNCWILKLKNSISKNQCSQFSGFQLQEKGLSIAHKSIENFEPLVSLEKNTPYFDSYFNKNSKFNLKFSDSKKNFSNLSIFNLLLWPALFDFSFFNGFRFSNPISPGISGEIFPVMERPYEFTCYANFTDFQKCPKQLLLSYLDRISYKISDQNSTSYIKNQNFPDKVGPKIGSFINIGDKLVTNASSKYSGQIIEKSSSKITLRLTQKILYSNFSFRKAYVETFIFSGNWIPRGSNIVTLPYIGTLTGDIIAGIPKVEQLFEARGEVLQDTLERLWKIFRTAHPSILKAARECFKEIGLLLVDAIQEVYLAQGVYIDEKHLEVIVRQMTRRVIITDPGNSNFIVDELVDFHLFSTSIYLSGQHHNLTFKPYVTGITRASLNSSSFLSSVSFQQTVKVIERESFKNLNDRLLGLKERVMMGGLIDAGTGNSNPYVFYYPALLRGFTGKQRKIRKHSNFFVRKSLPSVSGIY